MCDESVRSLRFDFVGNGPAIQCSQGVVNHPIDYLFTCGISICADVGRDQHIGEFQEGMVPADKEQLFRISKVLLMSKKQK